jgi:hypothetical protein
MEFPVEKPEKKKQSAFDEIDWETSEYETEGNILDKRYTGVKGDTKDTPSVPG